MLFAAQLWKYNHGKLENKNGDWMYKEETWLLSNESNTEEGQVITIRDSLGKILTVDSDKEGMNLKLITNLLCTKKWQSRVIFNFLLEIF